MGLGNQAISVIDRGFCGPVGLQKDTVIFCLHLEITQMSHGAAQQVYIPEDAVKAQKILILQIAAHAPFEDLNPQGVDAWLDCGR